MFGVGELVPTHQFDVLLGEFGQHLLVEDPRLLGDQLVGAGEDCVAQLPGHHAGDGAHGHAGFDASLQAGHSHHEELVEVGTEDGQELRAFQQWHAQPVAGLVEHALVERQPAQLTF